ncbi:unnamed protein product [Caenorhabditis nigoni]
MSANICVDDHELYGLFKRQSIPPERYQATDFRKLQTPGNEEAHNQQTNEDGPAPPAWLVIIVLDTI